MHIAAIVLSVALGGLWAQDLFGAVAGGALVWLVLRLKALEARLAALEAGRAAAVTRATPPAGFSADAPTAAAPAARAVADAPARPMPATPGDDALADPLAPAPVARAAALRSASATLDTASAATMTAVEPPAQPPAAWQTGLAAVRGWLLGGNTIAKAGVGILFIGLAFLARYATEHVSVPVELRLAGIASVALALLALGWRLRGSRPAYAQALQGGAVAVLYLTLFVGFKLYGLLAAGPVFALMVAVAALAAALAVLQDARALAVIGALGGFATPLLLSSGSGNVVALLGYYLVLDLGIAAVAWFKTWRLLNAVGFVFTFAVGTLWGVTRYAEADYAVGQSFLIAYFLLFNAILLLPARRLPAASALPAPRSDAWVNGSLLFGLPAICFVLQHGLVRHWPFGTALSALAMAGFYVLLAQRLKGRSQLAVTFDASLALAIVFLTLVIPFALDARSTAGAWALEGAGLVWLGLRQQRRLPRAFGYALLLAASGALVLGSAFAGPVTAVFNALFLNALLLVAGALVAALALHRLRAAGGTPLPGEVLAGPLLITLGTLWALVTAGVQIDAFVPGPLQLSAWLAAWALIALLYLALAGWQGWPALTLPLIGHAPLLALAVLDVMQRLANPAADGGWWAWPLSLAVLGLLLWRAAPHWPALARQAVHVLGLLVLAALGALQGRAITATWGDAGSAWPWLGWMVLPALLLLWLARPDTARGWPVRQEPLACQGVAGAMLAAAALVWTLLANAGSNGGAAPLPHLPVLNPLDLGVAAALLAAARWQRSAAAAALPGATAAWPQALWAACAFAWLNAMLVRAFHHYGGVAYELHAWTQSLAVHTGITLLWAATALVLMWTAARRALRGPWLLGAALLAAVVLKLLLVDLSGSGTVTRIVSFIGVGVLMLVIAYVAPLPAAAPAHEPR